jgi:hypothetical protein
MVLFIKDSEETGLWVSDSMRDFTHQKVELQVINVDYRTVLDLMSRMSENLD